jgi:cytochrome c-type biogenesis protein CcmF
MDYIGEHLVPGKIGHFFILLSLISSIAASVAYFKTVQQKRKGAIDQSDSWKRLARIFFITEALSVFSVFGILLYLVSNHFFEYHYVWKHSSTSLEPKYLLAAIWEGQEGSFLLWSIWHCVLGLIFIWREKEWEAPVMTVISFAQFILATMVAGIGVFGLKIGSNPFVLLRNEFDLPTQIPVLSNPENYRNYLSYITDGNDLNPLLQNYWMVIHPPVLFLGFASTLIPFAFAVGSLWTKSFTTWTKAALPWSLFSAGVLSLGIMMGAAWAYESLTFGGYWAWDPVENASLVPWMVLVSGIHCLLIYNHSGHSLRATYFFLILSFLLVLYSTYLTRSGDLQDTSVHAFTGEGITRRHLQILVLAFVLPSFFLFFRHYKKIPHIVKEEETSSREFWMFIGSLVLFLSAASIIIMTSIPVFNKIIALFTGNEKAFTALAMGEEAAFTYNRIQVFVAVIIGLLTAFGMYLKYKSTAKQFLKRLIWPSLAALIVAGLILAFGEIDYRDHGIGYLVAIWIAVAASVYAVIANASYIFLGMKGNLKRSGGAIAHVGFGLLLAGILISSSKKEILSYNTSGIYVPLGEGSKEKSGENLTLVKGLRTDMGKYWITYQTDSVHPKKPLWFYKINFESKDGKENFTLKPNAFVNYKGNEALMANPDSRHYWDHDIFTYVTALPDPEKNKDTSSFRNQSLSVGDTLFYSRGFAVLENVTTKDNIPQEGFDPKDSASVASFSVHAQTGSKYSINTLLINKGGQYLTSPDTVTAENLIVQLQKVNGNNAEFGVKESNTIMQYLTLKAYKFPFINLVWAGTLIMVFGFLISMFRRIQTGRTSLKKI